MINNRSPKMKDGMKLTTHKDGAVSYWSVYDQVWKRQPAATIPDREIAAMPYSDRRRIEKNR